MALATDGTGGYNPGASIPTGTNYAASANLTQTDVGSLAWQVYAGTREKKSYDTGASAYVSAPLPTQTIRVADAPTIGTLLNRFDSFSRKEFMTFKNKMLAAGILSEGYDDPASVRSAYESMLEQVYMTQASGFKVTPDQFLNNLIRMSGKDPSKIGAETSQKKRWKTTNVSRSKDIYELDGGEARSLMTSALQEYLGRDPSKGEIQDFMNAVETAAEDDPTTVKSTTTTKYQRRADGTIKRVASDSEREEDIGYTRDDAMWDAVDKAKASPDYGSYQAVSTYFPELERLLGASI